MSHLRELVKEAWKGYAELHLSTYLKTILKLDLFFSRRAASRQVKLSSNVKTLVLRIS